MDPRTDAEVITCSFKSPASFGELLYLEPADAVAELIKRPGYKQAFIDLIHSAHPDDDVDVELCLSCGELLFLMPDDDTPQTGLRRVWLATNEGKGIESRQSSGWSDIDEPACDHAAVNNPLTLADAVAALLAQPDRPGESRRAHDGVHQAIITVLRQGAIEGLGPCPTCKKVIFRTTKHGNASADVLRDDE